MRFGIIGPMDEEIEKLLSVLENQRCEKLGRHDYVLAEYSGHEVILVKSGIGKVCAAQAASALILKYGADCVINTGCAGGIGRGLKIGDIVLSDCLAYHDFDLTIFGYKLGQVPSFEPLFKADQDLISSALQAAEELKKSADFTPDVSVGTVLTGDQFISQKSRCLEMLKDFPEAKVTEMEGAAVAQICTELNVPFLVIRSVSDTAEGESPEVFNEFVRLAGDNSAELLLALMRIYKK